MNEPIRVPAHLRVRGTAKANAAALEDLSVRDPSPEKAQAFIEAAIGDGGKNAEAGIEDRSTSPGAGQAGHQTDR